MNIPLVFADAGIPMLYFHLPAMVLALVPVVVCEWGLSMWYFKRSWYDLLFGVLVANFLSMVIGFVMFWGLGVLLMILASFCLPYVPESQNESWLAALLGFIGGMIWSWPGVVEEQLFWRGLVLMIPAFFMSVYIEAHFLRLFWQKEDSKRILRFSWLAQAVSYPVLIGIWILHMIRALGSW